MEKGLSCKLDIGKKKLHWEEKKYGLAVDQSIIVGGDRWNGSIPFGGHRPAHLAEEEDIERAVRLSTWFSFDRCGRCDDDENVNNLVTQERLKTWRNWNK